LTGTVVLWLAIGCHPTPSIEEITADRDLRAARIQLPAGKCWVFEHLPPQDDLDTLMALARARAIMAGLETMSPPGVPMPDAHAS